MDIFISNCIACLPRTSKQCLQCRVLQAMLAGRRCRAHFTQSLSVTLKTHHRCWCDDVTVCRANWSQWSLKLSMYRKGMSSYFNGSWSVSRSCSCTLSIGPVMYRRQWRTGNNFTLQLTQCKGTSFQQKIIRVYSAIATHHTERSLNM